MAAIWPNYLFNVAIKYFLLLVFIPLISHGFSIAKSKTPTKDVFIVGQTVHKQALFWEKIFSIFPSSTVLFHDTVDPDLIIQLIDFPPVDDLQNTLQSEKSDRNNRDHIILKTLKEYNSGIEKIKREYPNFVPTNDAEERLAAIYLRDSMRKTRILNDDLKIRAQSGLADKFEKASWLAGDYLGTMEQIFVAHDLPPSLTRLAFVESMFNIGARSKVGASGLWQFMPETARQFMYVNKLVDERNSPIKATRAAAQLLLKNYAELKSWPHAITAYNHGVQGMLQAIKKVGSLDFDKTIISYQSPSFGFASRNFYGEFIAARRAYQKIKRKLTFQKSFHGYPSIVIGKSITLKELSEATGLNPQEISKYNPCVLPETLRENINSPLPKFYEFFAPKEPIQRLQQKMTDKGTISHEI